MLHAVREKMGRSASFEVPVPPPPTKPVAITLDGVMKNRLADAEKALDHIAKGLYPAPAEGRRGLPTCPHYFICPGVPRLKIWSVASPVFRRRCD